MSFTWSLEVKNKKMIKVVKSKFEMIMLGHYTYTIYS